MIQVTPTITLDEKDIQFDFIRASGPGGQNVNKVASAVQLRFDLNSAALPPDVRTRLVQLAGKRLADDGVLLIVARRYRTQDQNRQDALNRLIELIRQATLKPKTRRRNKPSAESKKRRLESKRRHSHIKRLRHTPDEDS